MAWIIAEEHLVALSQIICLGGPNKYITLYISASVTV